LFFKILVLSFEGLNFLNHEEQDSKKNFVFVEKFLSLGGYLLPSKMINVYIIRCFEFT